MGWINDVFKFLKGPQADNMTEINKGFRELAEDRKKKIEELEKEIDRLKKEVEFWKKYKRGMYE